MATQACAYCGHPLHTCRCDACDGWRGEYVRDATGEYVWEPCGTCDGSGTIAVCGNLRCQLDGKDHLVLVNQRPPEKRTA